MFKRIKELREKNKYSITDISKYLKMPNPKYILYENGTLEPTIAVLSKLAKLYNTSIDYIIGDTDEFVPHKKIYKSLV